MTPSQRHADILWLDVTDSTNRYLREASERCDNLSVVAAREQTSGRGQGTHTWHSQSGMNLLFSILYKPEKLQAKDMILITCATTLGILDYLGTKGVKARIKWPNDIWVDDRKICGILIENKLDGDLIRQSIIGIGFNLNQDEWPEELPNPVSLRQLTGDRYELADELEQLVEKIRRRFASVGDRDGESNLQEEFGKYVFRLPEGPA